MKKLTNEKSILQAARIRTGIVVLFLLLVTVYPLQAQDEFQIDIDDLFFLDDSEADEPADEPAVEPESEAAAAEPSAAEPPAEKEEPAERVDLAALTTAPLKVTGTVSAGFGAGIGLTEWPGSSAAGNADLVDLLNISGLYRSSAVVKIDARPKPYLRFYTALGTSLDNDAMVFTTPEISEIFIDYTLADKIFLRFGKQALTWGQGRLLGNPANLVSRAAQGAAVRGSVQAGSGTLNGVVYAVGDWIDDGTDSGADPVTYANTDPRAYGYAARWDTLVGPVALLLSGHFKLHDDIFQDDKSDIGAAASLSFTLGPFDAALDLTGRWGVEELAWNPDGWSVMGQLFWENADRSLSVLGEYQYDASLGDTRHHAALAAKFPKLLDGTWQPALSWKHAFQDGSGEFIPGISGRPAPGMQVSLGAPLFYGKPGSYYREAVNDELPIPKNHTAGLLLAVNVNFSF